MTKTITTLDLQLADAQRIGGKIVTALEPFCDRIVIAGSTRRGRALCRDIDIVALPSFGKLNELHDRLGRNTRVVSGTGEEGKNLIRLLTLPGRGDVQIDLFIAQHPKPGLFGDEPSNWGSILLCRTGPTRHNIRIVERAKDQGLQWDPYRGILDPKGNVIAAETEEQIYAALGLRYYEPAERDSIDF